MPLQNRVTPDGTIIATPARGLFMGNRGGRIHDPATRTLTSRRFASRRWICCETAFKGRHRTVMGAGYTELFFLDEPTALSAGHRPCFECRRAAANAFARYWQQAHGLGAPPDADTMDRQLHAERLGARPEAALDLLPDGAAVLVKEDAAQRPAFVRGDCLLVWQAEGYGQKLARPRGIALPLLTPPSIVAVLDAGYLPHWHPSAG
ncbi:hypothetical protein C8N35_101424 [Breoghania corrubedonensis]|uniref:Uncharacterized protein n=1 Tax=Breoghania corrubedonensis TaxID=665038 RepID=A0A2T5VF51_9HYPH|nr:hypothetical protein [Breoghania corrubedonensis]PTW62382.1 hypothetical protein C8N35_101424 [Breoghania corrubedonensis]